MDKLIITPDINVAELLDAYPQLIGKFIEIAPVYAKYNEPVLRRTVAKVTSLKQAAVVGGVQISELIYKLCSVTGQNESLMEDQMSNDTSGKPAWVKENKIKVEYDASFDLNKGIHPVGKVSSEIETLANNESYVLLTTFVPGPLIDIVKNKGFETFTEEKSPGSFATYISKKK